MTACEEVDGGVDVHFANRPTQHADLLICADGVGSIARARLLPELQPLYAGYVAWRGMVPERSLDAHAREVSDDGNTYHIHANSQFLVYPIPGLDGSVKRGGRLINYVWYRNYPEGGDLDDLLTDDTGRRHEISLPPGAASERHVAELRAGAVARLPEQMKQLVLNTDQPFLQIVYELEVPRMAFGRVCIIGDAAFAVRPHAAAGTGKSASDAWALAAVLSENDDVASALAQWEPGQLDVGRQLLNRTCQMGRRSQVDGTWVAGDPTLIFGLYGPGV